MRYYNIKNIKPNVNGGMIDYKGLDINQFMPGSQVYAYDLSECVIATTEDWQGNHPDVIELTQAEYTEKAEELRATYPEPEPEVDPKAFQAQIDALTIAVAAMLGGEA